MTTDNMATDLPPVRISKIAGRFLIFDPDEAAQLRRQYNTCGNLVGTVPLQPNQNLFMGLPIELRPEEVQSLVQRKAARVVDDVAAHRDMLLSGDRAAYIEHIRKTKSAAQEILDEVNAQRAAVGKQLQKKNRQKKQRQAPVDSTPVDDKASAPGGDAAAEDTLFEGKPKPEAKAKHQTQPRPIQSVTPTTSSGLVSPERDAAYAVTDMQEGPLARFLQNTGYYMTPGLRFGARYSVYPGDPLRFHAHFMATQYDWDQEVPIMDIIEGGRLATAVKKAFLIGGGEPADNSEATPPVRTYSIEWASM